MQYLTLQQKNKVRAIPGRLWMHVVLVRSSRNESEQHSRLTYATTLLGLETVCGVMLEERMHPNCPGDLFLPSRFVTPVHICVFSILEYVLTIDYRCVFMVSILNMDICKIEL